MSTGNSWIQQGGGHAVLLRFPLNDCLAFIITRKDPRIRLSTLTEMYA